MACEAQRKRKRRRLKKTFENIVSHADTPGSVCVMGAWIINAPRWRPLDFLEWKHRKR